MSRPVIYEVNMQVSKDIESELLQWLEKHIQELEGLPGFLPDTAVYRDSASEGLALSVHYQLADMTAMKNYMDHHAGEMRSRLPEEWRSRIGFSRRILQRHPAEDQ